jgi:mannose-6-phosphate isomerase-like protein (cupin superfamily)
MKPLLAVLLFGAAVLWAADPAGFHVWKSSEIKGYQKTLSAKLDAQKSASETIAKNGSVAFLVAHREGSGLAEWHEKQADIMIMETGEVTMIYGGEIPDLKSTAPGEMRGTSIRGGSEVKLGPGDKLYIPAKTPHLMKLEPGKQITYFVAKVIE